MPVKLIFLDCDGVISTREEWSLPRVMLSDDEGDTATELNPNAVRLLNEICSKTGAKIVITSTWRKGSKERWERLRAFFRSRGVAAEIIGRTPVLLAMRVDEIQAFLEDTDLDVSKFVIIDDDTDMGALTEFFVRTETEVGLTENEVPAILELLRD